MNAKTKSARDIRSYEADEDVGRMLNRAKLRGLNLSFITNKALRQVLNQMGFSRKKDTTA